MSKAIDFELDKIKCGSHLLNCITESTWIIGCTRAKKGDVRYWALVCYSLNPELARDIVDLCLRVLLGKSLEAELNEIVLRSIRRITPSVCMSPVH